MLEPRPRPLKSVTKRISVYGRLTNTCNRPVIAHLTFVGYNALGKIIGSEEAPYDLELGQSRVIGRGISEGITTGAEFNIDVWVSEQPQLSPGEED